MNSFNNMSGGFCKVEENRRNSEMQQQVWPCIMPSQNVAYNPCVIASAQNNILPAVQQSTLIDPFREDATEEDWNTFLFGPSPPVDTPIPVSSTTTAANVPTDKHYAHITFVPSAEGVRLVVSQKRRRTAFTTDQLAVLEEVFQRKQYITREERSVLVQRLAVGDQAIKVWFQNRRLKQKKTLEEDLEANLQYDNMFPHCELVLHHVDQYGRVKLTPESIEELGTLIHQRLPQDLNLAELISHVESSITKESESSSNIIYEPISPPEFGVARLDGAGNNTKELYDVEMIDPNQSLQRLLDIHRSLQ